MLKRKCALFLAMIMLMTTMFGAINVFATEVDTTTVTPIDTTENADGQTEETTDTYEDVSDVYETGVPEVTVDELEEKVERKLNQVVEFLQVAFKIVCIIFFIIGAIIMIVGAIGKGGAWKGLLIMGLAVVAYIAIMYAPEIVHFLQEWAIS